MKKLCCFIGLALAYGPRAGAAPSPDGGAIPSSNGTSRGCRTGGPEGVHSLEPEWVTVSEPNVATSVIGIAHVTHVSNHDTPWNHFKDHDLSIMVEPDRPFLGVLATGNILDADPDGQGRIELEWENSYVPMFTWPGEGDRVFATGQHIFDCGHGGGSAPQYRTEIHPPLAIATMRQIPVPGPDAGMWLPATRTDVFVSDVMTGASDGCNLTNAQGCIGTAKGTLVLAKQDIDFDIDAPTIWETPGSTLQFRVEPQGLPAGVVTVQPVITQPGTPPERIHIHLPTQGTQATMFSSIITAYWDTPSQIPVRRFNVTLDSVLVQRIYVTSLSGGPNRTGEWRLWAEISGHWVNLSSFFQTPVREGQVVPLSVTREVQLFEGQALRIFVGGYQRTCIDSKYGDTAVPNSINGFPEYLFTCGTKFSDDLGAVYAEHHGGDDPAGSACGKDYGTSGPHVVPAGKEHTGALDVGDFVLTYHIDEIPTATTGPLLTVTLPSEGDPPAASVGQAVTLRGSRFQPQEPVSLTFLVPTGTCLWAQRQCPAPPGSCSISAFRQFLPATT